MKKMHLHEIRQELIFSKRNINKLQPKYQRKKRMKSFFQNLMKSSTTYVTKEKDKIPRTILKGN